MTGRLRMPSFDGATAWLNSAPLTPADLLGQVVVVDFWTFTCINWLRTVPFVRAWARAYRDDGLVVVGVHTPEFSFEHEIDRVRQAVKEREIDYPVVIDNDYAIWRAFANHYWPALYFVGADGVVVGYHVGEGRYGESERAIQRMLAVERDLAPAEGLGVEAAADWDHLRTAETYLGSAFGSRRADEPPAGDRPARLRRGHWTLTGGWTVGRECAVLDRAGGALEIRFQARDAHLVLSQAGSSEAGTCEAGPIPFLVRVDGRPPGRSRGIDVDEAGRGLLRDGRLYHLVRERDGVRERTLEITFREPGAQAYVFTFG